ncbi:MAG: cysteine desulfurase family protein [Hyphomicrobiales bacterium]
MRTYLDHNATTPVRPEAIVAVNDVLAQTGNASSVHREGRAAKAVLERARGQVARLVGASAKDVTFTAGGTEANNIILKGAKVDRLLVSAVEHSCVLEAARNSGKEWAEIPVTSDGLVDLTALEALLTAGEGTALVSVMAAGNETGVVQPLREVADIVHGAGGWLHTDAVQAAGKVPFNMLLSGVDALTLSAHKLGGPAGAGALIAVPSIEIDALTHGGGQELRRRPGTENLVGIAGFGAAAEAVMASSIDCTVLRDELETGMRALHDNVVIFGEAAERLGTTTYFAVPGMNADMLLIAFDLAGIAVSSGSACSSGKVTASHVLAAMGVAPELGKGAIRVSLGWTTTREDVTRFLGAFEEICGRPKGSKQGEAA